MTTNNSKCINCEKTGLPILPVRYTVLPKELKAALPRGISGARVTDVPLCAHDYGLRTLREGWVYLFYEVGPRGKKYWEGYKVTADGRVWKQPFPLRLPLPRVPVTDPACAQRAIAVPMDLIAIERPEKCTERVFIAFSEHAWHKEVFDRYTSDESSRLARMQFIEPSKWVTSGSDSHGHAVVATEEAINDIVEYMPGFDPNVMAVASDRLAFSDSAGGYKEDWLKREVTRYPLFIRQASPASASEALVKLMKQIGAKDSAESGAGSCHPPMILALWDGIGNLHELNGFRGDPASWLDRYVRTERGLQVAALYDIDTAHAIVRSRTEQDENSQEAMAREAQSMTALGRPSAQRALAAQRAGALAGADPTRATQINAYYDDMTWMAANDIPGSYQTRLVQIGRATSAGSKTANVPYLGPYRDQIMNEARAYVQAKPGAHGRNLDVMTKFNWRRYEARLKRTDIENFRKRYQALQSKVFDLQEARSADVGEWTRARLFLDTLEDYQSTDLLDAMAFEAVVTDGIAGIGSTPKGKAILDALIAQWDPVEKSSLVWRVVAMNQPDARQELGQLLKTALAKKDMPLESGQSQANPGRAPGVDAVINAAGMIGKLTGYYKNLAKLALESDAKKVSPLGAVFKRLEVDMFGLTVGDAIFAKFRINQLGDFVGEKIIQTVLLQRAGVSYSDAMTLVRKQAEFEKISRLEKIERLLTARSLLRSEAPVHAPKATQALYDVWENLKSTEDGAKALRSGRIAVVAALMEAVNFYKIMTSARDRDTAVKLVQSGMSMLSSVITITMTPYYGLLKNSIRSQTWKFAGSALGAVGTFISGWMDSEKAFDAFGKNQFDAITILALKTALDGSVGFAILIDTTSTAAPLLKKLALRYGTDAVIQLTERVTAKAIAWATLRTVTALVGWEATVGLLVLQAAVDWLTPDELEAWCSRCAFGTGREAVFRLKDHDVALYPDPSLQEKDFVNAMTTLS